MSLKNKLMDDLKASMKNKDTVRKSVITLIRSAIKQIEVDTRTELDDNAILDIIAKQVKQGRDAKAEFEKAGRDDLVAEAEAEIAILHDYLPAQLTEEEIDALVKDTIVAVGASTMKDMGKVMGQLNPKIKGKADGKIVSTIVKKHLQ